MRCGACFADFHQHASKVFNQFYDFTAALHTLDCLRTHTYGQAQTTSQNHTDQNVQQEFCAHLRQHFCAGLRRQHLHPRHDGSDIDPHQRLIAGDQQGCVDGLC